MGRCLQKLPHSCGSRDGLQVFAEDDGSVNGWCYSCSTFVENPYGDPTTAKEVEAKHGFKAPSDEEIQEKLDFISTLGCFDLPSRRIRKESLEYYGVKVGLSTEDGKTPAYVHFPYTKGGVIVRYKTRLLAEKKMWSESLSKDVDMFGWTQAVESGAKKLIITEGEFDAIALHRIIEMNTKEDFKDYKPAVVSLSNGVSGAKKDLSKHLPEIRKYFKEIYLCFDMDEPGQKAAEEVCKICPEAKLIALPKKDANECLMAGLAKAAFKAVTFNASKAKNTRLVWGFDIHEKAKEKPTWGLSWPWSKMTDLTRGIRFGETIYIAAGEKMGKSEVVNAIAEHLITEHGLKVLLAKPEESNVKTYKLLASKVVGKIFHDPKVEFDEGAFDRGGQAIMNNVCMLNLYQNITWDVLKGDIYAAVGEGVKAVFIDPITNLTNGMSSGEINEHLQGVAQELAAIAKDLDIVIFIFCHLNKPSKGSTPWDRGGKITTDYFAGSSAMARSCHYAIGFEGNKDPELEQYERNCRSLVILADREYGESGSVKLYWNPETALFMEAD